MTESGANTELPLILGTELVTLDEKGRLLLAKKKRERLGPDFAIVHGEVGCLIAYPKARWEKLAREILDRPTTNPGRQQYSRLLLANSEDDMNCDTQGRFVIPKELRGLAKLGKDVLLVGCGDRMEIWIPEQYAKYKEDPDNYERGRRATLELAERRMTEGA